MKVDQNRDTLRNVTDRMMFTVSWSWPDWCQCYLKFGSVTIIALQDNNIHTTVLQAHLCNDEQFQLLPVKIQVLHVKLNVIKSHAHQTYDLSLSLYQVYKTNDALRSYIECVNLQHYIIKTEQISKFYIL